MTDPDFLENSEFGDDTWDLDMSQKAKSEFNPKINHIAQKISKV